MGESALAEIPAPSPCEKCAGPCDVEADGEKARLACRTCGHVFEVALVRAAIGTWTVVDPDGVVRRFASWQELIGSLPISTTPYAGAVDDRSSRSSRPSAAALLDVTPAPVSSSVAPGAPRLSLVPGDDPPPLPRQARPRVEEAIEDLPDEDIMPASDEITARMPPVRVSIPPPLPAAASMRPPAPSVSNEPITSTASSEPSEPPPPPALPPPPPAPKGGTLRTLPPPARRDLPAPPPPTIEVEPAPTSARAEKSSGRPAATTSAPPSARSSATAKATTTRTTDPPRASASNPPRRDAQPGASRWFLPFVAVGILALGFAYLRRSSPAETDTNGAGSGAGAAASSTSLANDPHAAASAAANGAPSATQASNASSPPTSGSASSAPMSTAALEAKPPTTGSVAERGPVGDSQLALPEVLERAAVARKSGDAPHAKALLERALVLSPGNAEAHGLLGDLARSQGDQAGAKASYEKALATSPSYYPALLGLADAEWDLGERDAAQRHYITIVGLGRSAPDRVKERALGGATSSSTAASTTAAPTSTASPTATSGTTESAPSPPP